MTASSATLGLIGCGKMGGALAKAFVKAGRVSPHRLVLFDKADGVLNALAGETGGRVADSPAEVWQGADLVVLAVKPQDLRALLEGLVGSPGPSIVVSVAAGVSLATLRDEIGAGPAIIRTMPNRPALVGAGMTALMGDPSTPESALEMAERLLGAAGQTLRLDDEALFDAVTGLSGSGPAFVFRLIEGLIEGGARAGLSAESAQRLAVETVYGAASLLRELGSSPADERVAVSSPGGTTVAGLAVLDRRGFLEAVASAVEAAAARSAELGST